MRKFFFLVIIVSVVIVVCACGYNKKNIPNGAEEKSCLPDSTEDSIEVLNTNTKDNDDNLKILHKFDMDDGKVRIFYQAQKDYRYQLYTKIYKDESIKPTRIKIVYDRYNDGNDFYADGTPDPYFYTSSPDGKNLYVITDIHANSDGWVTEYQLYKIDCRTLKIKLLVECAAIKSTKTGFAVAKARLTNEDEATCTADEIWLLHDEYLNWNGNVVSKSSDEYDGTEMERRYKTPNRDYFYVRNFKLVE